MKYIFISHADVDKPRLKPYLEHLLRSLPGSVRLWIDSPHRVGATFGRDFRVERIELGENWFIQLLDALRRRDCVVLAFWSRTATSESRGVVLREIDYGRTQQRCVQVCIDKIKETSIPSPFSFDHIGDISSFGSESDDGAYDLAMSKCFELIGASVTTQGSVSPETVLAAGLLGQIISGTEDEVTFVGAWEKVSNVFFTNQSVLGLLDAPEASLRLQMPDPNDLAAAHYIRFRLLCKQGKRDEAGKAYGDVLSGLSGCSESVHERLHLMATTRALADGVILPNQAPMGLPLSATIRRLEDSRYISEGVRIYESASIRSDELMLRLRKRSTAVDEKETLAKDVSEYASLVRSGKGILRRHDVVLLGIELYAEMWRGAEEKQAFDRLKGMVDKGYAMSKTRKNNIFFIQMLLADAFVSSASGEADESLVKCIVVAELIRRAGLGREHEGIAQLLRILKARAPDNWKMIDKLWERGMLQVSFVEGLLEGIGYRSHHARNVTGAAVDICEHHWSVSNLYDWSVTGRML